MEQTKQRPILKDRHDFFQHPNEQPPSWNHLHYLRPSFRQSNLRTGSSQSRTNHERSHPRIGWISHTSPGYHSSTPGKIWQRTTTANRRQSAWRSSREQTRTRGWKSSCPWHPQRPDHTIIKELQSIHNEISKEKINKQRSEVRRTSHQLFQLKRTRKRARGEEEKQESANR